MPSFKPTKKPVTTSGSLNGGAIAGIVIGVVVAVIGLMYGAFKYGVHSATSTGSQFVENVEETDTKNVLHDTYDDAAL